MRIVFDMVHPAHVHFFRPMRAALVRDGHHCVILARDKEVTLALLDEFGLDYQTVGQPSTRGRIGQLMELVQRDVTLAQLIRRERADVVVTRNPAGVQAARLAGAVGIFDTDDGTAAGVHFAAARPFAHLMTSPDCLPEYWGHRHWRYAGYKQSAYLHPDHFTPDPVVREELGVAPGERYFIVRFVAMNASHDSGESGMTQDAKAEVIERLSAHGRVFLSTEGECPARWERLRFSLPPSRLHHALAFASLVVGDSQTMSAEAAFLGTPALRASTFAGRIHYLEELQHRYELTWGYHPRDAGKLLTHLDALLGDIDALSARVAPGHARMMREKINVADWFADFIRARDPAPATLIGGPA